MPTISKPSLLYVLVSRDIQQDAADNMLSIMKIIDKFSFPYNKAQLLAEGIKIGEKPIVHNAVYSVATSWVFPSKLKADQLYKFKLNIVDPKGLSMGGPQQEHMIPAGTRRLNMNFNLQGMPATVPGDYKLQVSVVSADDKILTTGSYPFEVEFDEQPQTTALES